MGKNVLVIAAHPDDEVLGCGGTIARHTAEGDRVAVLILGEGITSRDPVRDGERRRGELEDIRGQARRAADVLGTASLRLHDFPDNRMDGLDLLEVVKVIESEIETVGPDIVYTHHWGDLNIDHRIVSRAAVTALRPSAGFPVSAIYAFEVPSSTEWAFGTAGPGFAPNHFVDVEAYFDKKVSALGLYSTETPPFPHPRSREAVRALGLLRGSQSGMNMAEGFELIRSISPKPGA